jgi:cytochrome P450
MVPVASITSATRSLIDMLNPEYVLNPYPLYHQLRSADPVYWDTGVNSWVLTRYTDVLAALHDPRLTSQRVVLEPSWFPAEMRELVEPPIRVLIKQMIFQDPPDHTRTRGPWTKTFTPRSAEAMSSFVRHCVDELLSHGQTNGTFDVVKDLATPLPTRVIVEILGVPPEDLELFCTWTTDFASLLDGKVHTRKGVLRVLRSVSELTNYFHTLIAQRRTTPKDDLLQALLIAAEQGNMCDEEELIANCALLLVVAQETTRHLIGNCVLALLQHPDQLQALREDRSLIPRAISETLRYDGPVQTAARRAREDLEIAGRHISTGQAVLLSLGAANRDPQQFCDPDRFDLHRQEQRHLAFGYGIHICLGAALARLQAEIALDALLRRFEVIRLATTALDWEGGLSSRGLKALPILSA